MLRNVGLTAELRARLEELRDSRRRLVEAQMVSGAPGAGSGRRRPTAACCSENQAQPGQAHGRTRRRYPSAELVDQLAAETDEAVAALRELAHGIYPPLLAAEGLVGALRARVAKAPLPVTIEADGVGRYPQEVEAAIYFCVLEAIQNVVKYAQASHSMIRLQQADGQLTFEVTDDGAGFDPAATPSGHGLTNMIDRLHALDGTLQIQSTPGGGTRVVGCLPVLAPAIVARGTR